MEKITAVAHELHHDHANLRRSNGKKTFSLETYLNFLHTRDHTNLSVDHINKIVSIHGFKKGRKKEVEEFMRTIAEPIHPARSTLKDGIAPSTSIKATITLTEAIRDLKLLNWQKCSATSIKTISSKNYSNTADVPLDNPDDIPLTEVAAKLLSLKGKKRYRTPVPLATDATSLMSNDSGSSKNGSGSGVSGDCVSSSMVPADGTKKEPKSHGSKPSKSGSGSDDNVLPLEVPMIGVKKRKTGIKRVYLKNLYNTNSDDTEIDPGLAATSN